MVNLVLRAEGLGGQRSEGKPGSGRAAGRCAAGRPLDKEPHMKDDHFVRLYCSEQTHLFFLLGRQSCVRSLRARIKAGHVARRAGVSPAASERSQLGRGGRAGDPPGSGS